MVLSESGLFNIILCIQTFKEGWGFAAWAALKIKIQIAHKYLIILAKGAWDNGEGIGNTILGIPEWQLCYRSQGGNCTMAVSVVHWVCTRSKWLSRFTAIRCRAGVLAIHNI